MVRSVYRGWGGRQGSGRPALPTVTAVRDPHPAVIPSERSESRDLHPAVIPSERSESRDLHFGPGYFRSVTWNCVFTRNDVETRASVNCCQTSASMNVLSS